jgi:hypothetical protein
MHMLRRALGAAVVTLALAASPATAGAAAAAAPAGGGDPTAGLAVHPEWGSVTGQGGVLKRSCHRYTYSYAITPPEGTWVIEIFISGPGLKHLGGGAFIDGYDPETGSGHYTLCRNTTRYGRFTIVAKLSVDDGTGHLTEGVLPPDTFRLRRPRH